MGYIAVRRACLHIASRHDESNGGGDPLTLTRDFGYQDTLRSLLAPHLQEGYLSTAFAATLMDTSVRTLARRLRESGTTYRSVVDEPRFDAAKRHLKNLDLRISDVASGVGFDDPVHFTRMFRRIAGLTPRQYRRAIQA
jgi:AraC-like DNA-binding protein